MTRPELAIMRAVLRYNAIPDVEHAEHINMSKDSGKGSLNRHAFRSYRIIYNDFTPEQRRELASAL